MPAAEARQQLTGDVFVPPAARRVRDGEPVNLIGTNLDDPESLAAAPALALAASGIPALEAQRWVNSSPLNAEGLRGKVVLVDIWEYTCINWIRTSPYVKALNRDYAKFGLVVIGVHAPEFEFGKRAENIDRGIRDHGLGYPIAIDNDFAIWRALGNNAWPAKYLFDDRGRLVRKWIGEGSYDEIERERRVGYAWYGTGPAKALKRYAEWAKAHPAH